MKAIPPRKMAFYALDLFVILIFVYFISQASHSYDKHYITYNISEQTWNDTNKTVPLFHLSYNFTAETFSAHPNNTITIDAVAFIDEKLEKKYPDLTKNIDHVYVYLPDAIPTTNVSFSKGHILQEMITLQRDTSHNPNGEPMTGDLFRGSAIVHYGNEGDKCTFVSTIYVPDTPDCTKDSHTIIHVAPTDSYFQLQSNKITNQLTFVLLAFTVLTGRVFVKDLYDNLTS